MGVRSIAAGIALFALGCGPKVEIAGTTGAASASDSNSRPTESDDSGPLGTTANPTGRTTTGNDSGADDEGGPGNDDDSSPGWDYPPDRFCENPDHDCSTGIPCPPGSCGDLFSPFDDQGCLRRNCTFSNQCDDDEVCFAPASVGGCASSGIYCSEGPDGECQCASDPDCGGAYCVPSELAPPTDCEQFDNPDSCFNAGCSAFLDARWVVDEGNTCFCNFMSMCVWLPPGADSSGELVAYYHPNLPGVYYFEVSFTPPPAGWFECGTGFEEPPECFSCFDELQFCV
jgi:hypothetical protein